MDALPCEMIHAIMGHLPPEYRSIAARTCVRLWECLPDGERRTLHVRALVSSPRLLAWSVTQGARPNERYMSAAARGGHADVVAMLYRHKLRIPEEDQREMARRGHADAIRVTFAWGDAFADELLCGVSQGGSVAALRAIDEELVRSRGYPYRPTLLRYQARMHGHRELEAWAAEHGYPLPANSGVDHATFASSLNLLRTLNGMAAVRYSA